MLDIEIGHVFSLVDTLYSLIRNHVLPLPLEKALDSLTTHSKEDDTHQKKHSKQSDLFSISIEIE